MCTYIHMYMYMHISMYVYIHAQDTSERKSTAGVTVELRTEERAQADALE